MPNKRTKTSSRWRERNPELSRAAQKCYYHKHKAEIAARRKVWRRKNRVKRAAYLRAWRKTHSELVRSAEKRSRNKNREVILARTRKWRRQNKEYVKEQRKKWNKANPEKASSYKKAAYFKKTYGIDLEERDRLWTAQSRKCAICARPSELPLDMDHDHETGKVRGILCPQCNSGLGMFQDNPDILHDAARYLERYRD